MLATQPVRFRFDREQHEYIDLDTGAVLPHITGMLRDFGLVDDRWYTEESADRGHAIHALTAQLDNGILGSDARSIYADNIQTWAHVKRLLGVTIISVEEPIVHPRYKFGGRPDRVVSIGGQVGILELKTGEKDPAHEIQTALQAILVSTTTRLPEKALGRWCVYLKPAGKFDVQEHVRETDFVIAERVIRQTTGAGR